MVLKKNVEIFRVSDIKPEQLDVLDLLIVGSPTRAFRPTQEITNLLKNIPSNDLEGVKVVAFDTRFSTADLNSRLLNILVKLFGYVAKSIVSKLEKRGGELIVPP